MKVTGSGEVAGKHLGAEADSWVISAPSKVDRVSWPCAHATQSHASRRRPFGSAVRQRCSATGSLREMAFRGHRAMGYSARTEKKRRRELAAPPNGSHGCGGRPAA
jgi:hypothetical protein